MDTFWAEQILRQAQDELALLGIVHQEDRVLRNGAHRRGQLGWPHSQQFTPTTAACVPGRPGDGAHSTFTAADLAMVKSFRLILPTLTTAGSGIHLAADNILERRDPVGGHNGIAGQELFMPTATGKAGSERALAATPVHPGPRAAQAIDGTQIS